MVFIHSNSHFLALFCGLVLADRLDVSLKSSGQKFHNNCFYVRVWMKLLRKGNKLIRQFTAAHGPSCTYRSQIQNISLVTPLLIPLQYWLVQYCFFQQLLSEQTKSENYLFGKQPFLFIYLFI